MWSRDLVPARRYEGLRRPKQISSRRRERWMRAEATCLTASRVCGRLAVDTDDHRMRFGSHRAAERRVSSDRSISVMNRSCMIDSLKSLDVCFETKQE